MLAMVEVQRKRPDIIKLLDQKDFNHEDFVQLVNILQNHPNSASRTGTHKRSTIWICCQHSECRWRRAVVPILVQFGANVNQEADNEKTPLLSLFNARKGKEHKRTMALILVDVCGADVPEFDNHKEKIDIKAWLADTVR